MSDEIENSKAYQALLEWEAAARAEIAECEKESAAFHEYEVAKLRRANATIKAKLTHEFYKLSGGKTIS